MRVVLKKNTDKKSKGYRLKISTHKLIDKIQDILKCSRDEVITSACRKYYKEIKTINNRSSK